MLERWRFDLKVRVPPAWPEAGPETDTVTAFLVRYPNNPHLHAFLYASPRLLKIDIPAPNALLDYAMARSAIRRAERALEAAKEGIVEFIRQAGSPSAEKVVHIRKDDREDAPRVTLFRRKTRAAARVVRPARRLSIQTVPEGQEPQVPSPPSKWTAILAKTKKGREKWEILSPDLYEFLVSNHLARLEAERQAEEAYRVLKSQTGEFERGIQALREWAGTARFVVQKHGWEETGWRDALAQAAEIQESNKGLLVISGLAIPLLLSGLRHWALVAVYEMPGGIFSASESEGWSFRFPREG